MFVADFADDCAEQFVLMLIANWGTNEQHEGKFMYSFIKMKLSTNNIQYQTEFVTRPKDNFQAIQCLKPSCGSEQSECPALGRFRGNIVSTIFAIIFLSFFISGSHTFLRWGCPRDLKF